MSSPEANGRPAEGLSYLRTLDPIQAVAAKTAISQFFGPVQEPTAAGPRPPTVVREPKYAMWVIGGGIALVVAAVLTLVLRDYLPQIMPGFYLGIGGIVVIIAGLIYAKVGAESVSPEPTPEKKAEMKAQEEIGKQIDHFRKVADVSFGPIAADGRRAHLVGIGRKEWNGNHEVPIVEVKGDRIWAAVVHLVSIDLTARFITIKQIGLHLATGTVHGEASSRYLLTDVMTATHEERKLVATVAWETAAKLAKRIGELDTKVNKTSEKVQAELQKLKSELSALTFEEPAGNTFMLTFINGERLELSVADCDHPNNKSDFGHPIGGKENLEAAKAIWRAISAASAAAKDAQHTAVTGVKDGLDAYQRKVVEGFGSVHGQLASLEGVMKEVLVAIRGQQGGGGGVTAAAPANGHAVAPAPAAVWPAPTPVQTAPNPQSVLAKNGA